MTSVLVAIGGNALVLENELPTLDAQHRRAEELSKVIADLAEEGYSVTVTHGNGPQVGFIMRRAEYVSQSLESLRIPELPLWLAVADSQGGIGHILSNALNCTLRERNIKKCVTAVVTHCVVDQEDRAFKEPNKPIGVPIPKEQAPINWETIEVGNNMVRRVVPSPKPKRILESCAVATLMKDNQIVIAGGGGGIPLIEEGHRLIPVDAVVDKDRTSALMALQAGIKTLILLTGVPNVVLNWGTKNQEAIHDATNAEMHGWLDDGQFPAGSMGPKIEAALEFLQGGGERVIITNIETAASALAGQGGTHITKENQ